MMNYFYFFSTDLGDYVFVVEEKKTILMPGSWTAAWHKHQSMIQGSRHCTVAGPCPFHESE